jgi:uncharacterized membrane protein
MGASAQIQVHRSRVMLQTELAIAYVLRGGVALAGALIALGLGLRTFGLRPVRVDSREIVGAVLSGRAAVAGQAVHTLPGFLHGLRAGDPDVVMALGLVLLVALPVVRVGMTVVLFLVERDWIYLAITVFVLGVLLASPIFGRTL